MKKLIQILFGIFLFTFPFTFRWVAYEQASYRFGNFNPWVTGFVYLPEILLGAIFVLWIIHKLQTADHKLQFKSSGLWALFFLFAINAFVITLLNGDAFLGAIFILRLLEGLMVFWLISDQILETKHIITILLFGAFVQIVWGYFQVKYNHSLGLWFLGESAVGPDILGVAKIDLTESVKQIRAYGSFLHPNILAAYLLTVFFVSLKYLKSQSKLFWLAIFAWGIYLTHSRAAMLVGLAALGLYFLFYCFRPISFRKSIALMAVVLLALGNFWFFKNSRVINLRDAALQERLSQNLISRDILQENYLGVGVNNFTLAIEEYSGCEENCGSNCGPDCEPRKFLPWEFQPVHNTYFLILNEVGIQGLIILALFLVALFDLYWYAGKAIPIFVLLFLAPFDHYLWDSWIGIILIGLVAGFFAVENHKEGVVEHIIDIITHKDEEDDI
ncbi:O-antigen ligase family protein [candidate division KSB1 bacterium]